MHKRQTHNYRFNNCYCLSPDFNNEGIIIITTAVCLSFSDSSFLIHVAVLRGMNIVINKHSFQPATAQDAGEMSVGVTPDTCTH